MKELSQEIITKINNRLNEEGFYDQGIFREPQNIPTKIKEPVVYMRWNSGGVCLMVVRDKNNNLNIELIPCDSPE